MNDRKNKVDYIISGQNYYNEPWVKRGSIEYDKLLIAKNLLKEISLNKYWGKNIVYSGLYLYDNLTNPEIMSIINEVIGDIFWTVDKIEIYKNTKNIDIESL